MRHRQRIDPSSHSAAFTLIELLVVISIISLLISILLPALSSSRNAATAIRCASDQRQVFLTTQMYSSDYNDLVLPAQISMTSDSAGGKWQVLLLEGDYVSRTHQVTRPDVSQQATSEINPSLLCPAGPDTRYRSHVVRDSFYPNTSNKPRMWVGISYNGHLGMIRNGVPYESAPLVAHAQVRRSLSDMYNFDCGDANLTLINPNGASGWPRNRVLAHPGQVAQGVFLDGSVTALGSTAITVHDQLRPDGTTRVVK